MSTNLHSADDLVVQLPLPLAQLFRRAKTSARSEDRHLHAYFLAEATLKLAASLRIGTALSLGLDAQTPLAQRLEKLCMPMVGEWVGFLRECTTHLQQRPDAALLPLASTHNEMLRSRALPAVKAFAEAVSAPGGFDNPPLQPQFVREQTRQGILGFFTILANYRNKVLGHGAPKLNEYYDHVGPLLMEAVCEVLRQPCLFGSMTLAVCRLRPDVTARHVEYEWRRLTNLGSMVMTSVEVGETSAGETSIVPGQVYFVGPGVRIALHPLVVYLEDRNERERVGFLNDTVVKRQKTTDGEAIEEVRRCEYLDYATGDHLRDVDVNQELTRLLAHLRGHTVRDSEIERLATASQLQPYDEATIAAPGLVIGDFEIFGELGRGAMGVVYKARQRSLNRLVALKVLPPALASDPVVLARFWREIAALARCEHPNLVKIITSGSDGDRHYYAMELVEGADLADLYHILQRWQVRDHTAFFHEGHLLPAMESACQTAAARSNAIGGRSDAPHEQAPQPAAVAATPGRPLQEKWAELFGEAAEGLAHLHARGILHRDLKPGNMMLTHDSQRLVIMDLGLAQVRDRTQGLTQVNTRWLGTLRYCSPEQLRWNLLDIDERADIYGFGAAMYEMVTLRPLFDGDSEARLIEQILHVEPVEPHKVDATILRDLSAIITNCLDKDRSQRYASADKLADDLRRFRRGLPVSVRPLTKPQRLWRWSRNNRGLAALTAAVASLLLVVSVGATVASLILADALSKMRTAQNKAQEESLRAQAERLSRNQLARTEDAASFAMLKEQIRAERIGEAEQTLATAEQRLAQFTELDDRRAAWERLGHVVRFYRGNDETWNHWGEENYAGVLAASQRTLARIGALAESTWWLTLPTEDLDRPERSRFEEEVYRLFMLQSAVCTVVGSVEAERVAMANPENLSEGVARATAMIESAFKPLAQAQSWEMAHENAALSISSDILEKLNRGLMERLGQTPGATLFPNHDVRLSPADDYFLGLMFFVVQRGARGETQRCPSDPPGASSRSRTATTIRDADLNTASPPAPISNNLLSSVLTHQLAQHNIPRGATPLETSESLLREAVGRERRYWPNFALGRTLYFAKKYSEAELAFGTCASLRPEYARSYEQRALMQALRARDAPDEYRQQLEQLARKDSDRALQFAQQASDPSTWWPRGDLHVLVGEVDEALDAYARALESEDDIREKVNRRNNVACVIRFAELNLLSPDVSTSRQAAANAVLALAHLALDESDKASRHAAKYIDQSLALLDNQPHALTARGLSAWRDSASSGADGETQQAALQQAIVDFDRVLKQEPHNYLAARFRAEAWQRRDQPQEALAAWSYLLSNPTDEDGFGAVAATDTQRLRALLGCVWAHRKLGREHDAQIALEQARRIDPSVTGDHPG